MSRSPSLAVACLVLALAVPSAHAAADSLTASPADSLAAAAAEKPYLAITYADSSTSVNTRCIVSGSHLNTRIAPVWVNGEPVGFC